MSEQKKIKQLEEENRRLKDAIGALTEAVNVFTQRQYSSMESFVLVIQKMEN